MENSALYPPFFARFYDVIYHTVRDSEDHAYFLDKMLEAGGPVLEAGVGTGRFFMDALKYGVDAFGIDISPAMIEVLFEKLPVKEHHRIGVADMCTFDPGTKFNLIVAPFRVFMHLLTIEEQDLFLENTYHLLNPGGKLIFDLFVPNLVLMAKGLDKKMDFEGEYAPGQKIRRFTTMKANPVHQVSSIKFQLEWEEGEKLCSGVWKTRLKTTFYAELVRLLKQSPFQHYSIFGDFNESPVDSRSKEFVVHCSHSI